MSKVLVIGAGGREHALVWALARSERVSQIFVAPGNAGTAVLATNVPIGVNEIDALLTFAQQEGIDLTVVGPEAPLAAGLVDQFQAAGLVVFGPSQAAAQLETSKAFAKEFMAAQGIPTATYAVFDAYEAAQDYVAAQSGALVVKADGLAAGKGVLICDTVAEAQAALEQVMVTRQFGSAGDQVIVEECLTGPEVSLLAFSDGERVVAMLPARDHKRAYDGDAGPNTGGMGAYAPPPDVDESLVAEITRTVLEPTIQGMAQRGTPYVGVLYAGIMLTPTGPQVLEFNCRFGDPETQVVLPMLASDLFEIMLACIEGRLTADLVRRHEGACATVVMASPGYPSSYPKGLAIAGIEAAEALPNVTVFQAGTKQGDAGLVTSGGRVLAVSALGADMETAVARAYEGVALISFEGAHFRQDIGRKSEA